MKTSLFDYDLPEKCIAQTPAARRDGARMMVLDRGQQTLAHHVFSDFPDFLNAGDLLVVNDTRVLPARIRGTKAATGGAVELLLLEEMEPGLWDVLLRASRRPKPGDGLRLAGGAEATLIEDGEKGRAIVRITSERNFTDLLEAVGEMPLPPYIKRSHPDTKQRQRDAERYQTVYARQAGAVAAPTAGLHFTPAVLDALARKGVEKASVTLHVGLGTFRPVSAEDVALHQMEAERYDVSDETASLVRRTQESAGRVVAVGSTTVRTLETVMRDRGRIVPCHGRSDLFIYPPYQLRAVDAMLTNFHLPCSTLLMMVCAVAGYDFMMHAYREAIREGYRFYSYGDCMLIL